MRATLRLPRLFSSPARLRETERQPNGGKNIFHRKRLRRRSRRSATHARLLFARPLGDATGSLSGVTTTRRDDKRENNARVSLATCARSLGRLCDHSRACAKRMPDSSSRDLSATRVSFWRYDDTPRRQATRATRRHRWRHGHVRPHGVAIDLALAPRTSRRRLALAGEQPTTRSDAMNRHPRKRKRAGNSGPFESPARCAGISLLRSRSVLRRRRGRAALRALPDCPV